MVPARHMTAKLIRLILTLPCMIALAHGDIPQKAPLVKYTGLWTNSPFTSKPPPPPPGEIANPLDDYTLTGIAPVPGGHRITIMNKKNPDQREVIEPGGKSEFRVVSVNRNPGKTLGTTVVLAAGSLQGTVTFEPELVTLKAPPAAPVAQQGNPNLPPGITAAQANQGNKDQAQQRQPRPRIVPPPTPSGQQKQIRPPSSQGSPQRSSSSDRTQRRR